METLKITPHEEITVRHNGDDRLEVEVTYAPQGKKPPAHYHPEQDEHFEVLAGELHAIVDGAERVLGPGDRMDIGRGTVRLAARPEPVVRGAMAALGAVGRARGYSARA